MVNDPLLVTQMRYLCYSCGLYEILYVCDYRPHYSRRHKEMVRDTIDPAIVSKVRNERKSISIRDAINPSRISSMDIDPDANNPDRISSIRGDDTEIMQWEFATEVSSQLTDSPQHLPGTPEDFTIHHSSRSSARTSRRRARKSDGWCAWSCRCCGRGRRRASQASRKRSCCCLVFCRHLCRNILAVRSTLLLCLLSALTAYLAHESAQLHDTKVFITAGFLTCASGFYLVGHFLLTFLALHPAIADSSWFWLLHEHLQHRLLCLISFILCTCLVVYWSKTHVQHWHVEIKGRDMSSYQLFLRLCTAVSLWQLLKLLQEVAIEVLFVMRSQDYLSRIKVMVYSIGTLNDFLILLPPDAKGQPLCSTMPSLPHKIRRLAGPVSAFLQPRQGSPSKDKSRAQGSDSTTGSSTLPSSFTVTSRLLEFVRHAPLAAVKPEELATQLLLVLTSAARDLDAESHTHSNHPHQDPIAHFPAAKSPGGTEVEASTLPDAASVTVTLPPKQPEQKQQPVPLQTHQQAEQQQPQQPQQQQQQEQAQLLVSQLLDLEPHTLAKRFPGAYPKQVWWAAVAARKCTDSEKKEALEKARLAFELFDFQKRGTVAAVEIAYQLNMLDHEVRSLQRTLCDYAIMRSHLDRLLGGLVVLCFAPLCLVVFDISTTNLLVTLGAAAYALNGLLGHSFKGLVDSLLLILVHRPFDVGDRISMDDRAMIVTRLGLFTSDFQLRSREIVTMTSVDLLHKQVVNHRRSGPTFHNIRLALAMGTPMHKILALKENLLAYLKLHPILFIVETVAFFVRDLLPNNTMLLDVWVQQSCNWSNGPLFERARSRLHSTLKQLLDLLEIAYVLPLQPLEIHPPLTLPSPELHNHKEESENTRKTLGPLDINSTYQHNNTSYQHSSSYQRRKPL
eukprot:g35714.t1